jgi:hypothetical protein
LGDDFGYGAPIEITHHQTVIISITPDNVYTLRNGGHFSRTTAKHLTQYSPITIRSIDNEWYVVCGIHGTIPWCGTMRFDVFGNLLRPELNHYAVYNLLAIDVWGNAKEGYEINDSYRTDYLIGLNDEMSDEFIIKAVRRMLGHRADTRGYTLDTSDGSYLAIDHVKRGPSYHLQLVLETD